jgi:hypothetical protein
MVIMAPVILAETSNGGTSQIYLTMEVSPFFHGTTTMLVN